MTTATPRQVSNPGINPPRRARGPNGRPLCRMCGDEIVAPRLRSFCGNICVHRWRLQTQPGYCRDLVWKRDRGVCATCLVDTATVKAEDLKALGYNRDQSRWQMDHTVPLSEGGLNQLGNLRTLCVPCHKSETAALKKRLAGPKQVKPRGWSSEWPRKEEV